MPDWRNKLYYGDNLQVMRERIADSSVDAIYLDPPFESGAEYNTMFAVDDRTHSAQIRAFHDTWRWGPEAAAAYEDFIESADAPAASKLLMEGFYTYLGTTSMMAYLCMMAPRLVEMRRVLKDTGSIFLHCDPTASHFIKLLMDSIFGEKAFKNEIVWHYSGWNGRLVDSFNSRHDIILFYSARARPKPKFLSYSLPWANEAEYVKVRKQKVYTDEHGRDYVMSDAGGGTRVKRYIDEAMAYGRPVDDVWDLDKLNNSSAERLGYPTQKPEALLERIISCCTEPGDLVLDPFSGCGTCVAVAQKLHRNWIGIDITVIATRVIQQRFQLWQELGLLHDVDYEVMGLPADMEAARDLASHDSYQFQAWAVGLIPKAAVTEARGNDHGIDGRMAFRDRTKPSHFGHAVISVKGMQTISPTALRDLAGTVHRDNCDMGILLTLAVPSRAMLAEATAAGTYNWEGVQEIPRLQIMTVEQLLDGMMPQLPPAGVRVDFQGGRIRERAQNEAEEEHRATREDDAGTNNLFNRR